MGGQKDELGFILTQVNSARVCYRYMLSLSVTIISGGPLMYLDPTSQKYVLIGTLLGYGYRCGEDKVDIFEGSNDGIWNKVSNWVPFIKREMRKQGEKPC